MNLSRYNNTYSKKMFYIGLGVESEIITNPSTQFNYKKPRKSAELNRLLQSKVNKMKSILQLNNSLMRSIVEEEELNNDMTYTENILPTSTNNNDLTLNFKNIISNNDIKEDTTLQLIIDSVKKFQTKEKDNSLFNILNMRNNKPYNKDNDKIVIDDNTKQKTYPLLSTLNVPFTSHTISVLLYEIVKLSQQYPKSSLMNITHPQGSFSKVFNVSK